MSVTLGPTAMNACEQESIHTPGAIQPHGVMLVAEIDSLVIRHVAGDATKLLGTNQCIDRTVRELLGDALAAEATSRASSGAPVGLAGQFQTSTGMTLDVAMHRSGEHFIIELEPASTQGLGAALVIDRITAAAASLARAGSLVSVCDQAAIEFRRLTEFDRVMVYRFDGDGGAGEVWAEDARSGMHSFLHHHFPAGDIPAQARALYVHNLLRVIPDTSYTPALLQPAWASAVPLDLTYSNLRSVSGTHLQYLHNMGVQASASFSIVIDGRLWGLITCHHEHSRGLTYDIRSSCQALVESLARQIKAREEADNLRQRIRLLSFQEGIVSMLSRSGVLADTLSNHLDEIRRMMDSDGVAILRGHEVVFGGRCPDPAAVQLLAEWLMARDLEPIFATERLPDHYPPAIDFVRVGSGVMSMTLSQDQPWIVIWFRAEQTGIKTWAGDPKSAHRLDSSSMPAPRLSFQSWVEMISGQSRRWLLPELDAVIRLRLALLEVQQTSRTRELNLRLTRLIQDKDILLQQKEFLISEINHRVQNSLQLVSSFLAMQARSSHNDGARDALHEARRRMAAVGLVHRRLYRGHQVEMVDADRYIEELCADTFEFMGSDWAQHLTLDLAPTLITTDRAVTLGLILTELLINANKHAYGGVAGPLRVELGQERTHLRLCVSDQGIGNTVPVIGFGSRVLAGLIAQVDGVITRSDNKPGLLVVVRMPIHPERKT